MEIAISAPVLPAETDASARPSFTASTAFHIDVPLPRRSAWLGYLADSSYWVYLVHMPMTIGFGALLFGLEWPAGAKIGLNIAATSLLSLASYHLLVRYSAVGTLLNGQRHTRAPRPLPSAAPAR